MIKLDTLNVSYDSGLNPPIIKQKSKLCLCGISYDCGVIPPKNFFRPKIKILSVDLDLADDSLLYYTIL